VYAGEHSHVISVKTEQVLCWWKSNSHISSNTQVS